MERKTVLDELLQKSFMKYHMEYGDNQGMHLSNHITHGIIALYRQGASAERLREWFDTEVKVAGLEPTIPPTVSKPFNDEVFQEKLGKKENYANFYMFFAQSSPETIEDVYSIIRCYFKDLLPGIGGAIFHGLIQLGYALEVDHPQNALTGLAYLAYVYSSLGTDVTPPKDPKMNTDPLEILKRVREDDTLAKHSERTAITFQIRLQKMYAETGDALSKYNLTVPQCGKDLNRERRINLIFLFLIKAFYQTKSNDFIFLHTITAFRSLKVVLLKAFASEEITESNTIDQAALQYYWRALLCSYITHGRIELQEVDIAKVAEKVGHNHDWDTLKSRAIKLDDVHIIKIIYVLATEYTGENWTVQEKAFLFDVATKTLDNFIANSQQWSF